MSKLHDPKRNLGLLIMLLGLHATSALAEKADREQPINLEADTVTVNDAKKTSIYTGNVILTQGTLEIRGDKLIVREDREGFQHSTSTGNPTTFKQKLEGKSEYMSGSAQRIEYEDAWTGHLYQAWVNAVTTSCMAIILSTIPMQYAESSWARCGMQRLPSKGQAVIQPKATATSTPRLLPINNHTAQIPDKFPMSEICLKSAQEYKSAQGSGYFLAAQ